MNRKRLALASVFTLLLINPAAKAENNRHYPYVNYDLLCKNAVGLQYVALDLKDCFSAEFRRTGYYGKLVSRTSRIKHLANRLHRRGLAKSTCNWCAEIHALDELVCEVDTLVQRAVYDNRGYGPICPITLRKVRSLLRKAGHHVNGLERSLHEIEYGSGTFCSGPRPRPVPVIGNRPFGFDDVPQGYAPGHAFGNRVNRPEFRETEPRNGRNLGSHIRNFSFDQGGFRFTLK